MFLQELEELDRDPREDEWADDGREGPEDDYQDLYDLDRELEAEDGQDQ